MLGNSQTSEHTYKQIQYRPHPFDEDVTPFDSVDPDVFANVIDDTSIKIQDQDPLDEWPGSPRLNKVNSDYGHNSVATCSSYDTF